MQSVVFQHNFLHFCISLCSLFTIFDHKDYHYDTKDPERDYEDMQSVVLRSLRLRMPTVTVGANSYMSSTGDYN